MTAPVINFYPYQQRWLKDDSRFKIGMFSRQTGKTFTTCGELVDDIVNAGLVAREVGCVVPELVELVVHARRRGYDAQLELAAQRVRDDRVDGAPDFLRAVVEGELVEHHIRREPAGSVGVRRQRGHPAAAGGT